MRRPGIRLACGMAVTMVILGAAPGNAAAPSLVTADIAVGTRIRPAGGVTGECSAKITDTNGQTMSVLVVGSAQSWGVAAATGISCTIYQDSDFNLVYDDDRGGCSRAMPLNVAECHAIVDNVPLAPFKVCARASSLLLSNHTVTATGPGCPDFV